MRKTPILALAILFLGGSRRDATVDFVIVIGLSRRSSKSEGGCA